MLTGGIMILCAVLPYSSSGDFCSDLASRARQLRFRAVVLHYHSQFEEEEAVAAGKRLEREGLRVPELGCYINLIPPDEEQRAAAVARIRAALRQAKALCCPAVATVAGTRDPGGNPFWAAHPENFTKEAWVALRRSVGEILVTAEELGVDFCLEPLIHTPLNTVGSLRQILDEMRSPRLKILFDPVNLITLDEYFKNADFLNLAFDVLGDSIAAAHAKDTLLQRDKLTLHIDEVRPGLGELDFETFLKCMDVLPEDTPLAMEHLQRDEDFALGRDYIQGIAARIGVETRLVPARSD